MADIINMVMEELPTSSNAAFQESQSVMDVVRAAMLTVDNLIPVSILDSKGAEMDLDLSKANIDRDVDIAFMRFSASVDCKAIDERITTAGLLAIEFSLRLPQHIYDSTDDSVTLVTPPNGTASSASGGTGSGTARRLFSTPTSGSSGSTMPFSSPKMGLLSKNSSGTAPSTKRGYFGKFDFLDDNSKFHDTFGSDPILYNGNPVTGDKYEVENGLTAHLDKCRLDVFMCLCEQNYVGASDIDKSLSLVELGHALSKLKQEYRDNNRIVIDTPDELFDRFTAIATCLPDDASNWPTTLCTTYYSALTKDLIDSMADDKTFKMPKLTTLHTKSLQLDALRTVRSNAVVNFNKLQKQSSTIDDAVQKLLGSRRNGNTHLTSGNFSHEPIAGSNYLQRNASLAEQTMQRYKGGDQQRPADPPTKFNPSTGQFHPWNEERQYLSRFPLSFRGCFICGGTDHRGAKDCPVAQSGNYDKKQFFDELWAHKPHTKRPDREKASGPALSTAYQSQTGNGRNMINSMNGQHVNNNQNYQNYQTNQNNQNYQNYQNNQNIRNNQFSNQNIQSLQQNRLVQNNQNNDASLQQGSSGNGSRNAGHYYGPSTNMNPLDRNVDNTPAWLNSSKEDATTKKRRLWITRGVVLSTPSTPPERAIPLAVNNKLPAIAIRFGSNNDDEVQFLCHIDSCAGMNTGNLLLHQWIITNHPDIVESYEEYNDAKPFVPLRLDVAIPTNDADNNLDNQLTAVVTYKTRYRMADGTNATLSFGLGKDIQVNAIVGLPQIKTWKILLDLDDNKCFAKLFNIWLPIEYDDAATGMPPNVQFTADDFKRPAHTTTTGGLLYSKTTNASYKHVANGPL